MPHRRCVLIADDDVHIREMLATFLKEEGYCVLAAENGKEAVGLAKRHRPLCILMDLNMPVLDGVSAIEMLKCDPEVQWIPVYAMSARWTIQANARRLRADGILKKPFDLAHVLQVVNGE
jgi:CheY-like chemotaxis protein